MAVAPVLQEEVQGQSPFPFSSGEGLVETSFWLQLVVEPLVCEKWNLLVRSSVRNKRNTVRSERIML